jgi:hypothetical protein
MPSRVIRDGILESEAINSLSWPAELFYRRLMSVVDDFGRYNAHSKLLRSRCYPLQFDIVADKDVTGWLNECVKVDLVRLYRVENKPFLELSRFNQRTRQATSKFPAPGTCNTKRGRMTADAGGLLPCAHEDEGEDEDEVVTPKRKKGFPKGWKPNAYHVELAVKHEVSLDEGATVFEDWARANGHKYVDWDRTFSNAVRGWLKERCPSKKVAAVDATGEKLKKWK